MITLTIFLDLKKQCPFLFFFLFVRHMEAKSALQVSAQIKPASICVWFSPISKYGMNGQQGYRYPPEIHTQTRSNV